MEIKIEQSNSYTKSTGSIIKRTKNEHSERTIAFPTNLIEIFKKHEKDKLFKKEILGEKWFYEENDHLDDFIFTQ